MSEVGKIKDEVPDFSPETFNQSDGFGSISLAELDKAKN